MVSGPNSQGVKLRRCDDKVKNKKIVCRTICEMAKKFFCKPRQLYWRGCVGGGGHNSYFSIVKTQFTFNTLSNHSRRRVDSFTFSFHEEEVEVVVVDGWLTSSRIKLRGGVFYPEVERDRH